MGRVTTLFARRVAEEVEGGVDKDALLRSVGLERSGSVDPSHMIEDTAYYEFLERAAAVDPRATTRGKETERIPASIIRIGVDRRLGPSQLQGRRSGPALPTSGFSQAHSRGSVPRKHPARVRSVRKRRVHASLQDIGPMSRPLGATLVLWLGKSPTALSHFPRQPRPLGPMNLRV